jgi:hypothetical protein
VVAAQLRVTVRTATRVREPGLELACGIFAGVDELEEELDDFRFIVR